MVFHQNYTNEDAYSSASTTTKAPFCLALKASAKPPANPPPPPLGVLAPLPPSCCAPFACCPFEYPLSLGVGGGAGFLPAGRLAGGAGGVGLAFVGGGAPPPFALFGVGGGGGRDAAAGAGGGGGGAWRTSSSHHPGNRLLVVCSAHLTTALALEITWQLHHLAEAGQLAAVVKLVVAWEPVQARRPEQVPVEVPYGPPLSSHFAQAALSTLALLEKLAARDSLAGYTLAFGRGPTLTPRIFTRSCVNLTRLIQVQSACARIPDSFDCGKLSRLLVVLDLLPNLQVKRPRSLFQLREELRFENTVDQWVRLLWTSYAKGEPIVLQMTRAHKFDRSNRHGAFGEDGELLVHHCLLHNVHSLARQDQKPRLRLRTATKLADQDLTPTREECPLSGAKTSIPAQGFTCTSWKVDPKLRALISKDEERLPTRFLSPESLDSASALNSVPQVVPPSSLDSDGHVVPVSVSHGLQREKRFRRLNEGLADTHLPFFLCPDIFACVRALWRKKVEALDEFLEGLSVGETSTTDTDVLLKTQVLDLVQYVGVVEFFGALVLVGLDGTNVAWSTLHESVDEIVGRRFDLVTSSWWTTLVVLVYLLWEKSMHELLTSPA
ncbi:Myosin-1 [Hortaea werneckii]|nr:Myosin-1 [Hortaea werneckii]